MTVCANPLADWHEDIGPVLWWCFPVTEPPYVGTPLDLGQTIEVTLNTYASGDQKMRHLVGGWPGYHTHWTPIPPAPTISSDGKPITDGEAADR